ncbi:MAG: flagellar basal body L-ring protein FlgH [Pseudomonadota bacterium]|nr:flagellar basal body L-ring protein FlgH [Pseudomonadota bacterium]
MSASHSILSRLVLLAGVLLAGCSSMQTPQVAVHEPTSARAEPSVAVAASRQPPPVVANGSIFQVATYRPLFEDRRARHVGDLLTIELVEKTSARKSSSSSIDRSGSVGGSITALPFVSSNRLNKLRAEGESSNSFGGKGETGSDNMLTGTITVTVVEVLPNGNLLVSGEKQVGVNQNVDVLRFSGVVPPQSIQGDNRVASNKVADARVEFRGRGDVDRAQTVGWLSRFFLSWLPI